MLDRLRGLGYSEIFTKPIVVAEVAAGVRRQVERQELAKATGLYGEARPSAKCW